MKLNASILSFAILSIAILAGCQKNSINTNVKLTNSTDSASYALGVLIGDNNGKMMKSVPGAEELNMDIMIAAFVKAIKEQDTGITAEEANQLVQNYFMGMAEKDAKENEESGKAFLAENKKREGIVTTESGLQYEVIQEGNGEKPSLESMVECHYHGTLVDGTVFDSSYERGEPVAFPVNGVIEGWTEALQLMSVGAKWKLYIPSELAYGEHGAGGDIKPNSVLIFDVELLDVRN